MILSKFLFLHFKEQIYHFSRPIVSQWRSVNDFVSISLSFINRMSLQMSLVTDLSLFFQTRVNLTFCCWNLSIMTHITPGYPINEFQCVNLGVWHIIQNLKRFHNESQNVFSIEENTNKRSLFRFHGSTSRFQRERNDLLTSFRKDLVQDLTSF